MPLQMYAVTIDPPPEAPVDFDASWADLDILHMWNGHPDLHGWLTRLYHEKGGACDRFWDCNLVLTARDIDRLERDIRAHRLPRAYLLGQLTPHQQAHTPYTITVT